MTLEDGAVEVLAELRRAGHSAYFAGGCVRDLLLGRKPKDWDIATSATPEEVVRLFKRTLSIGAAFGVVKVLWKKGEEYEVATYRTEGDYSDGRRPDRVHYSRSPHEDVDRRDFTLNALLLDPAPGPEPRPEERGAERHVLGDRVVLDFVRGVPDLQAGLIRAVGDVHARFHEDRLRMLRAVRFAARFGFQIEAQTRAAIAVHAQEIKVVSVERIVTELDGIWASGRAALGARLLAETGLFAGLEAFIPGHAPDLASRLLRLDHLVDVAHAAQSATSSGSPGSLLGVLGPLAAGPGGGAPAELRALAPASAAAPSTEERILLAWALLLEGDPRSLEATMRGLKFSRDRLRAVEGLLALAPRLRTLRATAPALPAGRRLVQEGGALARWYQLALIDDEGSAEAALAWSTIAAELARDPLPTLPLVGGAELKALGVPPGPAFKGYLAAVDEAVYARTVRTQEEAKALLASLVAAGPPA